MPTLGATVDMLVSTREYDAGAISRLTFWVSKLGHRELTDISADDVDAMLVELATRGRVEPRRGQRAERMGRPLKGSTINTYITTLGGVYKHARRLRLLPRSHIPPTRGLERHPEPPDPGRYLRPEEVERLIKTARVLDTKWGKLEALIITAYHTGLRRGNLMALRWRDVDLTEGVARVERTKNGEPITAVLSTRSAQALSRLPHKQPDDLVFCFRPGRPYTFRPLWDRACEEAGLPGKTFHMLRHGCGHALATAGVNQAQIMAQLGHRTLSASARYMHASTSDKRAVVERVFG